VRARVLRAARAGHPHGDGQLQPGDRLDDYDTSDRLYFEPLTLEDVLEVVHAEQQAGPVIGVMVQLGGQTPLGLARGLKDAGVPIVGTSPEAIHLGRGPRVVRLRARRRRAARSQARDSDVVRRRAASRGGDRLPRAWCGRPTCSAVAACRSCTTRGSSPPTWPRRPRCRLTVPVLVDRFLDDAIEIDVDAIFDGEELYLGGVMEHIEEAGIHSGDSACVLPPVTLGREEVDRVRACTEALARGLGVQGLLNVQFALAADVLYVLEANPRASRTAPFVSKATGVPLAKVAARVMLGATIAQLRVEGLLPEIGDGRAPGAPGPGRS
jgi:carbamoyl-phosphate synthase large subunit